MSHPNRFHPRIRGGGDRRVSRVPARSSPGRRSRFLVLLAAALAVAAAACETSPTFQDAAAVERITELPRALSAEEVKVLWAANAFGFDLLRELQDDDPASSHCISPLSASMVLGMTMNGAARETLEAMRTTLRFEGLELDEINASYRQLLDLLDGLDPTVSFQIANSMWYLEQLTPDPDFAATLRDAFDAEMRGADFDDPTLPSQLDRWVREKTEGRIDGIAPPEIDRFTIAFLLNAMHFRGAWRGSFDRSKTRSGDFHLENGTTARVRYMVREGGFRAFSGSDYTAVEIPYGGDAFVMTVVLPPEGGSVNELVASLDDARWAEIVARVDDSYPGGGPPVLHLPRFTLEWGGSLRESLGRLGMGVAFTQFLAQFPNLFTVAPNPPYLHDVTQKTFVRVDEEGTEAAAATAAEARAVSGPSFIYVDRPFVFAIRERLSGTILFLGVMREAPVG